MISAIRSQVRAYTEGEFYRCASVEAVDAALKDAEDASLMLQRHMAWLQDVRRTRINETARRSAA